MKLLLTSAGIKNATVHDALLGLLGKPIAECDALCIPTASYGHAPGGIHGAWRFVTGQATTPMCELGWKSLGMLELTALPSLDEQAWLPVVEGADVLLANGGDALYLAHHMRLSGPGRPLAVARGRLGGAERRQHGDDTAHRRGLRRLAAARRRGRDARGRRLLDLPARGPPRAAGEHDGRRRAVGGRARLPAYAIDDDTAIRVVDGTVDVVSEGHWRRFPA